jgi:hypothetical protein
LDRWYTLFGEVYLLLHNLFFSVHGVQSLKVNGHTDQKFFAYSLPCAHQLITAEYPKPNESRLYPVP